MTNAPFRLPSLPFALRIGAAQDAPHLAEGWATHAVSLLDPLRSGVAEVILPPLAPRHLIQQFDDIEKPTAGLTEPGRADVEAVLAFTRTLASGDRLLCHCHAGISRSPAMAIAILVQHGVMAEQAVAAVAALQSDMWPNEQLCRHADAVLATGGTIMRAQRQWLAAEFARLEASGEAFA